MQFVWERVAVFVAGLVVFVMMIGGMAAWLLLRVIGLDGVDAPDGIYVPKWRC